MADTTNESRRKKMDWTEERKVALLAQIMSVGDKAFSTFKDGVGGGDGGGRQRLTQAHIWTNKHNGILHELLAHEAFSEFRHLDEFPAPYASVLTSVKKWVTGAKHLFTQGQEQREPIECDHPTNTEDTKNEKYTEFDNLIVQVAALMKCATDKAARRALEKEAERAASTSQNAAAQSMHQTLTDEEIKAAERAGQRSGGNTSGEESCNDLPERIELEEWIMGQLEQGVEDAQDLRPDDVIQNPLKRQLVPVILVGAGHRQRQRHLGVL